MLCYESETVMKRCFIPRSVAGRILQPEMANTSLFDRILVPVDGSAPSLAAVDLALTLAQLHRGTLVFCHALDLAKAFDPVKARTADRDVRAKLHELRKQAHALLSGLTQQAQDCGIHSISHAAEGDPIAVILGAVKAEKPSLVVMGVGGTGGVRDRLGSVSAAVLATGYVPVLLMREPAKLKAAN
jgi:nucleotide-binding universal stress UspA family protein